MYVILLLAIVPRLFCAASSLETTHPNDQIVCLTPTYSDKAASSWPAGRSNILPFAGSIKVVMQRMNNVPDHADRDQAVPARFIRYAKSSLQTFYGSIPEDICQQYQKALQEHTKPSPALLQDMQDHYNCSLFTALQLATTQLNFDAACKRPGADNPVQRYVVEASYAGQTCNVEVGAPEDEPFIRFLPSTAYTHTTRGEQSAATTHITHAQSSWSDGEQEAIPFAGSIAVIMEQCQPEERIDVPKAFVTTAILCLSNYFQTLPAALSRTYQETVMRGAKPSKELFAALRTYYTCSLLNALQQTTIELNTSYLLRTAYTPSTDQVKRYLIAATYAGQTYLADVGSPEAEPFIRSLPSTSMAWHERRIDFEGSDLYIDIEAVTDISANH